MEIENLTEKMASELGNIEPWVWGREFGIKKMKGILRFWGRFMLAMFKEQQGGREG